MTEHEKMMKEMAEMTGGMMRARPVRRVVWASALVGIIGLGMTVGMIYVVVHFVVKFW